MIRIIKTEFMKLKRYSILFVGILAMLACVLLTRFMAIATDGTRHTLAEFSSEVIWNSFSLIFPATITLIAGSIMERERTDDTLKNISVIPVSFRKLLVGKLCLTAFICIILSAIEFLFTLVIVLMSRYPGYSFDIAVRMLYQMIGSNLCVLIAVLPIIIITCQRKGFFINGVVFAFFYGFVGIFAAGHGLTNYYPITAGLGLINYQSDVAMEYNKPVGLLIIVLLILVSIIMVLFAENRVPVEKGMKKKHK